MLAPKVGRIGIKHEELRMKNADALNRHGFKCQPEVLDVWYPFRHRDLNRISLLPVAEAGAGQGFSIGDPGQYPSLK